MRKSSFLIAILGLVLTTAPLAAKNYSCDIRENGARNKGLPVQVLVWHDEATGQVKVLDGIIQNQIGKPIAAKVSVDNKKRITFSYQVNRVPGSTQYGGKVTSNGLAYRLTIQKTGLSATMSMKPLGFSNTFRGKGQCVLK